MDKQTVRTQIRLPEALYEALSNSARKRGRSLNAEMVDRLIFSFSYNIDNVSPSVQDDILNSIEKLTKEVERLNLKLK
ncbi:MULTISPECIES: Arc family DNA-binding protein [unclassified Neisseria]|uniref:Arc family DNA-binding protein n=1 Tax=unclassified Neisseria TaxID=2623750 RepID=UPI002666C84D|nr:MULTISPECIES: Arc family DNA-binding protein [unclassified Neisseria]MDO1510902.1 Arc family DNA-binding protein [Neisseria sp. MVDL19-042950]MDO1517192.1 Arc family DNA-binding protein [Neisseria sp. MVDL18-041461]MDO1564539.1 Arc family DNA-binding protein [Neisseria sp. MVDL20-010259]